MGYLGVCSSLFLIQSPTPDPQCRASRKYCPNRFSTAGSAWAIAVCGSRCRGVSMLPPLLVLILSGLPTRARTRQLTLAPAPDRNAGTSPLWLLGIELMAFPLADRFSKQGTHSAPLWLNLVLYAAGAGCEFPAVRASWLSQPERRRLRGRKTR